MSSRTYFLSGFDPRGATHYKRMFQSELKPLGWRFGKSIDNGLITRWPLKKIGEGDEDVLAEFCFLHWDDIAKANWPRNPLVLLKQCAEYAWWYLLKGGLIFKVLKVCPGVALCGAYPLLFLFFSFGIALGLAGLIGDGLATFVVDPQVRFASGLVVGLIFLWQAWRLANKLGVVWLARSIMFTHRVAQHRDHDLRERVKALADWLVDLESTKPALELRLVGHSSGSFVLAMLAAELHRHPCAKSLLPRLSLLTLGQNLANVALYPGARLFRDDLEELSTEPRIPWRDVTSKQDFLCFAGVNPYTSCGLTRPSGDDYPQLDLVDLVKINPRVKFWDLLGKQFEIHFLYLRNVCSKVALPSSFVAGLRIDSND